MALDWLDTTQDSPEMQDRILERMTDLTRRLVAVPKSELPTKRKRQRKRAR